MTWKLVKPSMTSGVYLSVFLLTTHLLKGAVLTVAVPVRAALPVALLLYAGLDEATHILDGSTIVPG